MAESTFQLAQLFGTTDFLAIIGFKDIEYYQNSLEDIVTLRIAYLRKVIRSHPDSSGILPDTPEGIKEVVTRSKKLWIMEDIYKFLTNIADFEIKKQRSDYFAKGTMPELPSLKYLRDNSFKGDARDYKVPDFEDIAAELKALFQQKMKEIREMQETYVADEETSKPDS